MRPTSRGSHKEEKDDVDDRQEIVLGRNSQTQLLGYFNNSLKILQKKK